MTGLWVRCQNTFQFTPLREGRRKAKNKYNQHKSISIHAPPRGATIRWIVKERITAISIHAPPRGATVYNQVS